METDADVPVPPKPIPPGAGCVRMPGVGCLAMIGALALYLFMPVALALHMGRLQAGTGVWDRIVPISGLVLGVGGFVLIHAGTWFDGPRRDSTRSWVLFWFGVAASLASAAGVVFVVEFP